MAKPKPLRVVCDDFELDIGGRKYRLHEGEWVELVPILTVGDQKLAHDLMIAQANLEACKGDQDEREKVIETLDVLNDKICAKVAASILAWNWTDDSGQPLPQPNGQPEVLLGLRQEEVMYLYGLAKSGGQSAATVEAARKNGSRPSPTSTSATRRTQSRT